MFEYQLQVRRNYIFSTSQQTCRPSNETWTVYENSERGTGHHGRGEPRMTLPRQGLPEPKSIEYRVSRVYEV